VADQSKTSEVSLFVPPGHFYSPLVDGRDSAVQKAIAQEAIPTANLTEFGIDESEVLHSFAKATQFYDSSRGIDQPFPTLPTAGWRFHFDNPAFPLADAMALLTFMVESHPHRYIEVGAGHSSCAALDINERYLGNAAQMTFIDPHPETYKQLLGNFPDDHSLLIESRLQDVPTAIFQQMTAGDILFIDSSHVAKTGSDVVDYMFRILPVLPCGVLIHIHDIFFPFEYPHAWIVDENRSWNEAYFLRAFLHGNSRFRVLYLSDWIYKRRRDLLEKHMPLCIRYRGGSLWMQVV
jgi:hypothetical protein